MAYTEEELFVRTVAAEARGEGQIGQALVARSILNRAGLIQSGTVGKGTFLANDASITGVIYGKGQYQVVSDGSINKNFSKAELDSARKAIAIARNPADLRGRLEAQNIPPNEINSMMGSTGFRTGSAFNDPSQNVNVTKVGNHYFNTAGNSTLKTPNANVKTTISPGSTESPADIRTASDPATGVETKSNKPVPVPDTELEFDNQFGQLSNDEIDAKIEENRKEIDELNEKSSDLWTDEEKEKYKEISAETDALIKAKVGNDLQEGIPEECNARETAKGFTFKDTPDCEKYFNSVSFKNALAYYKTERDLPNPCGTSEMSKINTTLQKFFEAVKGIKKYGDLYVNGTINKLQNITALIRNTSDIIGAVLKTLINRLRDFLLDKIRKGISDLINMLLPTVAKVIKNTIIQAVVDNIFCAFKDIVKNLVNMAGDFLFELVGKIVNVPFCAAQQFTNALVNNIAAIVDNAVGPILDKINDVLGGVTKIVGNVFQALDFILGFEAFLCAKPNCPEIKKFKASPWGGPSQAEIDNFAQFLDVPSESEIVEGAIDFIDKQSIFGQPLGDAAGKFPSSTTDCDVSAFKCGPPSIEIFGGGGAGAVAEAIVDNVGRTIGVNLINGGSGYTRPPFVSFVDGCGDTFTSGYAVISEPGTGGTGTGGTGGTGTGGTGGTPVTAGGTGGTPVTAGGTGGTPVNVGGIGGTPVTAGGTGGTPVTAGGTPVTAGGTPVTVGGTGGTPVTVGGIGGTPVTVGGIGGTPVTAGGTPVTAGGIGGTPVTAGGTGTGTGGTGGQVVDIILTTTPPAPPRDGRTEFDPPSDVVVEQPSNDFVVCLEGFRILDTGVGYTVNDSITITPDIPGLTAAVQMTEFGQIVSIQVGSNACGLPGLPEIEINSPTGEGAIIEPIVSFTPVAEFNETDIDTGVDGDPQLQLDGPIDTLRGRSVLVERGFTRKDLVRVVDCVS